MRVLIIGAGEVGQNIATTLSLEEGHEVTVVDSDEARVDALAGQLDAMVLAGNGASPRFLEEIDAGQADLLLAVTQIDEVNIIAALAGHQLGAKRTVARVRDPDYFGTDESFARDVLGIDFVIHPERTTAEEIAAAIMVPGAVNVEHFGEGQLAIAETILSEESPLLGIPLAERAMPCPHFIVGVIRNGTPTVATAEERLEAGDHVLVAASKQHIAQSVAHLAGRARKVEDVVLFGAGKIGLHLAKRLDASGVRLKVMERDADRARYVAERLPHSLVLHEEGVGKEVLLAEGVDRVGAFVASAGDDRANLLATMHAKQVGAGLSLAVVSREEFVPLVGALGIDGAFSPRLITASAILRFLRRGHVMSMHLIEGGSEMLELQADERSPIVGQQIKEAGLPEDCMVGTILRAGHVLVPRGEERIQVGDRVLLFAQKGALAEVERAFEG